MNNDYALTLTTDQCQEIAKALDRVVEILKRAPFTNGEKAPAASKIAQAPNAARDHWMHDKEGKEIPQADAEGYQVRIWKCEQTQGKTGPFLDVRWEQKRAYCHDAKLFPWILGAFKAHSQIILYLRRQNSYDHIVGVRM